MYVNKTVILGLYMTLRLGGLSEGYERRKFKRQKYVKQGEKRYIKKIFVINYFYQLLL